MKKTLMMMAMLAGFFVFSGTVNAAEPAPQQGAPNSEKLLGIHTPHVSLPDLNPEHLLCTPCKGALYAVLKQVLITKPTDCVSFAGKFLSVCGVEVGSWGGIAACTAGGVILTDACVKHMITPGMDVSGMAHQSCSQAGFCK